MAAASEMWRSKLGSKYQKKDIEAWDAQLKLELCALRKAGCNSNCFDCGATDVTWASPKLGIFLCVACSDVHRAAGAHITCVKNFSTYLWGPDEVQVMRAIGNCRGRDLYGNVVVYPSDSKQCKVDACTKKYGCAQVQKTVEDHITAAKADAAGFPKPNVQSVTVKSVYPIKALVALPQDASREKLVTVSDTDWFDRLFASNEVLPEQPADKVPFGKGHASPSEVDLDVFLDMCNSLPATAVDVTKQSSSRVSDGLDDEIFEDFGKW